MGSPKGIYIFFPVLMTYWITSELQWLTDYIKFAVVGLAKDAKPTTTFTVGKGLAFTVGNAG